MNEAEQDAENLRQTEAAVERIWAVSERVISELTASSTSRNRYVVSGSTALTLAARYATMVLALLPPEARPAAVEQLDALITNAFRRLLAEETADAETAGEIAP